MDEVWESFGGTVLLVEDDAIRVCTSSILRELGFEVVVASDGEQALSEYRLRQFQVVLMDLTMPGMDGLQALHEIRAINPDEKVILCSGYGDVENNCQVTGEDDRPVAFLPKPYRVPQLKKVLREAVQSVA